MASLEPTNVPNATALQSQDTTASLTSSDAARPDEQPTVLPSSAAPLPSPFPRNNLLVASPYTALPHLLDLTTVSTPCQLLARAFTFLKPLTPAYATTPYPRAFNWTFAISQLRTYILPTLFPPAATTSNTTTSYIFPETSFYIIVFRSRVLQSTSRLDLGLLDADAHQEAVEAGGLLKYWFGEPDELGRNLATCVWRGREDAVKGGSGPGHERAMRRVRGLYKEWKVERWRFVVEEGAKGWRMENWTEERKEVAS